MRSILRPLVVLAVLALTSVIAAAGFTSHLDPLVAEAEARVADGGLSAAQRSAASKAAKTLNKRSKSVDKDLTNLAAAAKGLAKAFPDDAEMAALTDTALGAFRGEVDAERDLLASVTDGLPEGKARDKATNALGTTDELLATFDAGGTAADRAKTLAKAYKTASAARRAITGGSDVFLYGFVDGKTFQARTLLSATYTPVVQLLVVQGVHIENFRTGKSRTVTFDVKLAAPGSFGLGDGVDATYVDGNFLRYDRGVNAIDKVSFRTDAPPPSGTMTVTRFDADARLAEGTFTATLFETDDEGTPVDGGAVLTIQGAFRVRFVVLQ
jgi:hypothetical protein